MGEEGQPAAAEGQVASTDPASVPAGGWYYVVPGAPPIGPYDEAGMHALVVGGYVTAATCVWREGCASWLPICEVQELQHLMQYAPSTTAAADAAAEADPDAAAAAGAGAAGHQHQHAPVQLSRPAAVKGKADAELEAFEAEIQALEGEGATAGDAEGGGAETPEELEFEDDDGTVYVWNARLRKYVAKELQQAGPTGDLNYEDMVFAVEEEVLPSLQAAKAAVMGEDAEDTGAGRKRQADADDPDGGGEAGDFDAAAAELVEAAGGPGKRNNKKARKVPGQAKPAGQDKPPGWFELKVNTSVYVTGLPDDVTAPQIVEAFSKYGVIKEDEHGQPRVKIYRDKATGMPKGDALVTYLKEPSVALAVQLLDGTPFRFGMGKNMTVQAAKFEMKGETFQAKQAAGKGMRKKQLQKLEKRLQWGGSDDKLPAEKVTVIIKHMFHPDDFLENMVLSEELEADVKSECGKLGVIEKLRVFKTNPEGVVSVRFREAEPAQQCVQLMNGRWFGGRQLVAHMYDGLANYAVKVKESWEEQEARLEAFARELEAKEGTNGTKSEPASEQGQGVAAT